MMFVEAFQIFESKCQSLSHFCCQCCQMTGMTIRPSCKNESICTTYQASYANSEDMIKNLPIWYNENIDVQYQLSKQLKCLHEGKSFWFNKLLSMSLCFIYKMAKLDQGDMFVPLCKISPLSVLFYQAFLMMFFLLRWLKSTYKRVVK